MNTLPVIMLAAILSATALAQRPSWDTLERTLPGHKVEVSPRQGNTLRGEFVSINAESIVVRGKRGEQSIPRTSVRRVAVHDPPRRLRNGLLSTAVGLGAGIGIGFAVCPYCGNEGHATKFVVPGMAAGAGLGALGFLPVPYRTVYRSK